MRFLLGLWHQLWITAVVALLLLALYTSLGRQLIPLVETLRPDIEVLLSEKLGKTVTIGELAGDWRYLAPILRATDLRIGEDGQVMSLASFEIELDISASAFHLKPVFNRIEAKGLQLNIQIDEGIWSLAGFTIHDPAKASSVNPQPEKQATEEQPLWLELLELQQRMSLQDSQIRVYRDGRLAHLTQINQLKWRHQGSSQTFNGKLSWGRDKLADIQVGAALNGPLWPWDDQNGEVVARVEPQAWEDWIPDSLPLDLSVQSLEAGGELWFKVRDGDLSEIYGDFAVDRLQASGKGKPLTLNDMSIVLGGKHTGKDWHARLKADSSDQLPISEFTLSSMVLDQSKGWQVGIDQLDIGAVNGFLTRHALLPAPFDRYFSNISPTGQASDLRVSVLKDESLKVDVKAELKNVSGQAYAGIPGISGIDASLHLQPRQGKVSARKQTIELNFAGVYDEVWPISKLDGDFYWQIGPDISHIWLDGLKGQSQGMSFTAAASMALPSPRIPELETRLRLLMAIPKADVANRDLVLPDLLEPELRTWIVDAFSEGQLSNGALLLDGVMEPERDENSLSTQLLMDLSGIRMSYLEGWPEVREGSGRFFLNVPDVDVHVSSLKTLGGELVKDSGRIRLTPETRLRPKLPDVKSEKKPTEQTAETSPKHSEGSEELKTSEEQQTTESENATPETETAASETAASDITTQVKTTPEQLAAQSDNSDQTEKPEPESQPEPEPEPEPESEFETLTRLVVEGKMAGPVEEALAYFHQTPMQQVVNHGFDDWRGSGDLTAQMSLSMLLGENVPEPDVKMRAWLENDSIQLQGLNLNFTGITGVMDFDSRVGVSSEKIVANLFGGPVEASFVSNPEEGGFSTQVKASGRAAITDLRNWMPNVLLAPVSGDLGYDAQFSFDTTNGRIQLDVQTPLDGTLIDYPEPFYKAADDTTQPLDVSMVIPAANAEPRIEMNYNNRVRGIFALNDIGVDRGQVYVGDIEPYLPSDSGIQIRGEIAEPFIAEPWWDKWVELQELALEPFYAEPAQAAIAASAKQGNAAAAENPVRSIDMKLSDLTAADMRVPDFHVVASQNMGEWDFRLASGVVGGTVVVPASIEQPVQMEFDYLHLPPAEDSDSEQATDVPTEKQHQLEHLLANDSLKDMIPGDLLPMNMNLKELFIGGLNLGVWKVESRPIENGAAIKILESDMKGLQIAGDMRWLLQDGKHSTHVDNMQIKGSRLARIQSQFRMDPMMDAKKGRATVNLSWLGSPMAFNPHSLNGLGSFRMENGVWKAEGAGAIKAFGLLNFNSISRRLQLDFSDVYESGVAFDVVRAKAKIEDGQLTLVEPFVSDGPGAKFFMSGNTDMVAQSLDMKLAVTFPVTGTLPIVAVLAGFAAPIAASIYVTEKLIGNELERFTSASYDVRGTWSEPDMKIRGAFDNQVDGKQGKSFKDRVLSIFGLDEAK